MLLERVVEEEEVVVVVVPLSDAYLPTYLPTYLSIYPTRYQVLGSGRYVGMYVQEGLMYERELRNGAVRDGAPLVRPR